MRITKKWIKTAKQQINERIKLITALNDEQLKAMLESACPSTTIEGTRDEMMQKALLWAVDYVIPDNLWW